jgi:hypothetical protein
MSEKRIPDGKFRLLKAGPAVLSGFLRDSFEKWRCMYLDLPERTAMWEQCVFDWKNFTALCAAVPRKDAEKLEQWDLCRLMDTIPETVHSMYAPGRSIELTFSDTERLLRGEQVHIQIGRYGALNGRGESKRHRFHKNCARFIKIDSDAVFEWIRERVNDEINRLFDVMDSCLVYRYADIDWETATFFCLAQYYDNSPDIPPPLPPFPDVDYHRLVYLPDTTVDLCQGSAYMELTEAELIALQR